MKIAIQGIAGSFHAQAATELFQDHEVSLVECMIFRDVFDAVTNDKAEYGIVAIENSLHGSINPVYRLLAEQKLFVCGEIRLQIELFLIGLSPAEIEVLNAPSTEILSQREALSQCEIWLADNLTQARVTETSDTADAVHQIIQEKSDTKFAIASRRAAKEYHGTIIAGPINDDPENYTRFLCVTKQPAIPDGANRTSIIMSESDIDRSGTLVHALNVFANRGINLSKLDSHPLPGEKRRYAFYIDVDTSMTQEAAKTAMQELIKLGWDVQILGSYRAYKH
ncbi:MAG: prephenate dehydratase domain-containing protein [Candidatus Saccharibacteria bacterium]